VDRESSQRIHPKVALITRNANLDEIAQKYAGSKAAIEAGSNYFTIYDTLSGHLDVTLVNPSKAPWLTDEKQKDDRRDAKKLARFLRMDELPESYVPPKELRKYRALARGRKKLKEKQTDFKNEVQSLLDQHGITRQGSLWSQEGREFLAELTLGEPWQSVMEQWLEAIDEFETKINQLQDKIETVARDLEEVNILTSVPGIAAYSGLMIYSEIGEIERFDQASEVVSYAGLDPIVRESGNSRTEGGISKQGNGYLRWILVQWAQLKPRISGVFKHLSLVLCCERQL
jgi:transposase